MPHVQAPAPPVQRAAPLDRGRARRRAHQRIHAGRRRDREGKGTRSSRRGTREARPATRGREEGAPAAVAAPAAAGTVAAAPAAAPAKPIQPGTILPNAAPGTSFVLTGYAKVDGMWTDTSDGELAENNSARDFYVPGARRSAGQTKAPTSTRTPSSRASTSAPTRSSKAATSSRPASRSTSSARSPATSGSPTPTRRSCATPTCSGASGWSARPGRNFQDVAVLPDAVDFIGPTDGTVFVRQPQVRYTKGGLSLSVENPRDHHDAVRRRHRRQRPDHDTDDSSIPTSPPATPGRATGVTSPWPASRANSSTKTHRRWPRSTPARGRWPAACPASS